jgi:hypothetical protein
VVGVADKTEVGDGGEWVSAMHMFIENTNRDKFFSMRAHSDPIFPNEETKFSRLTIDQLK